MKNLLKNQKLQKSLDKEGFCVLKVCSKKDISSLLYEAQSFNFQEGHSLTSSSFNENLTEKVILNKKLASIVSKNITKILKDHKPLGTAFLVKKPGKKTKMPIHQDWTIVNEELYASYTLWVALQDIDKENGALRFIPKSHRFFNEIRSPSILASYANQEDLLSSYLKDIPLKAGEGVIFNHAVLHASYPNLSSKDRVAFTYGFVSKEATLHMYFKEGSEIEKYEMPNNFLLNYPRTLKKLDLGNMVKKLPAESCIFDKKAWSVFERKTRTKKKMKPFFKDHKVQKLFEREGYVKIPAIQNTQIEKLKKLYLSLELDKNVNYGFHVGMDHSDKEKVEKMMEEIQEIVYPLVSKNLVDTQWITASFVVKEPMQQSVVPPHQDWSFVEDEERYCSVTCWIPLQDVNKENGCLGLIPKSQDFWNNVRPSPSPQVATPLKEHMFNLFPYIQFIEMKAGEALIFNNKTIHASLPNMSNSARLAVGLGFTQKGANIIHYTLKPRTDNVLLKYKIDKSFFLKYDNNSLSKMYDKGEKIENYELIGQVPYQNIQLSEKEMKELLEEQNLKANLNILPSLHALNNENTKIIEDLETEKVLTIDKKEIEKLPFWRVYTPLNIYRELKYKISKI